MPRTELSLRLSAYLMLASQDKASRDTGPSASTTPKESVSSEAVVGDAQCELCCKPNDDVAEYGEKTYWDTRFEKEVSNEWVACYEDIKAQINSHIPDKQSRILILGCGNSALSGLLCDDGFHNITSTDYSGACVRACVLVCA